MTSPTSPTVIANERVLSANPRSVFTAFENADQLAKWWGPAGFSNTFELFEFKPNGRWVYVMHGPKGTNYPNESIFREVTPNSRIVIEHIAKPWYRLTIQLSDLGDRTHLYWEQEFDFVETANRLRPLCESANEENLDKLEALLRQTAV